MHGERCIAQGAMLQVEHVAWGDGGVWGVHGRRCCTGAVVVHRGQWWCTGGDVSLGGMVYWEEMVHGGILLLLVINKTYFIG